MPNSIEIRDSRDVPIDDVIELYRANDWSSANKPDLLKIWWVDGRFIGEPDAKDTWKKHQPIVRAMIEESRRLGIGNGVDAIEAWKAKEVAKMGGNLVHGDRVVVRFANVGAGQPDVASVVAVQPARIEVLRAANYRDVLTVRLKRRESFGQLIVTT